MRSYGENQSIQCIQGSCTHCTRNAGLPAANLVSSVGIQASSVAVSLDLETAKIVDKNHTNSTDASLIKKFHQKK